MTLLLLARALYLGLLLGAVVLLLWKGASRDAG
jgi:hypothetical protein